ncbi:hypothetical protein SEA_LILBEANIE_63 [Gordonia phage Lilbeanie]|uniref:Uncharacterized protein n=1 Tax=Gordonia phage Lilbeanie TaxID=2794947 RepID=A0A7T1KSA9_9CAUD|nr:hypothetical protein J1773_gp63 [Gordonia phage Lilbeanie]QPO17141.1 hypothetical protein SEA_LILBEANIE_63 [Gordonia phage Lilbeanie]
MGSNPARAEYIIRRIRRRAENLGFGSNVMGHEAHHLAELFLELESEREQTQPTPEDEHTNEERAHALLHRAAEEIPEEIAREAREHAEECSRLLAAHDDPMLMIRLPDAPDRNVEEEQRDARALAGVYASLAVLDELKAQRPQDTYEEAKPLPTLPFDGAVLDRPGYAQTVAKLDDLIRAVREEPHLVIDAGWLAQTVDHCTCGTGGSAQGHEPGCGAVPLIHISKHLAEIRDYVIRSDHPIPE